MKSIQAIPAGMASLFLENFGKRPTYLSAQVRGEDPTKLEALLTFLKPRKLQNRDETI